MRTLLIALLALAALPLAAAQEPDQTKTDDGSQDAWVKDCPPDMMCAYGTGGDADENATYKGDCGADVCATEERPTPYGNESCIECTGGPVDDGATCMDGQQVGETCRDDVQYLDGRGPAGCENCRGDEAEPISSHSDATEAKNDVPLPAVLVVLAALAAAVLVVRRA